MHAYTHTHTNVYVISICARTMNTQFVHLKCTHSCVNTCQARMKRTQTQAYILTHRVHLFTLKILNALNKHSSSNRTEYWTRKTKKPTQKNTYLFFFLTLKLLTFQTLLLQQGSQSFLLCLARELLGLLLPSLASLMSTPTARRCQKNMQIVIECELGLHHTTHAPTFSICRSLQCTALTQFSLGRVNFYSLKRTFGR